MQHIEALFEIERDIDGHPAETRRTTRQILSALLLAELHRWLSELLRRFARDNDVARTTDYRRKRRTTFTRFLDNGGFVSATMRRHCAKEHRPRAPVIVVLLLGLRRTARCGMYDLIVATKINNVNPQAWLADVVARIAEHPAQRISGLLPRN